MSNSPSTLPSMSAIQAHPDWTEISTGVFEFYALGLTIARYEDNPNLFDLTNPDGSLYKVGTLDEMMEFASHYRQLLDSVEYGARVAWSSYSKGNGPHWDELDEDYKELWRMVAMNILGIDLSN